MIDDSTKILGRPQTPMDDDTRALPRDSIPAAPPPGGRPAQPKRSKRLWLILLWGLLRLGGLGTALLLAAQFAAGYLGSPLGQWIAAFLIALLVPVVTYVLLRRATLKRAPKARVKVTILTWCFGWNLLVATLIWVNLPGIGTMAVGTQGANLARGVAAATSPDRTVANAIVWVAEVASSMTGAVESAVLGDDPTAERRDAGRAALENAFGPSGAGVAGKPEEDTASTQAGQPDTASATQEQQVEIAQGTGAVGRNGSDAAGAVVPGPTGPLPGAAPGTATQGNAPQAPATATGGGAAGPGVSMPVPLPNAATAAGALTPQDKRTVVEVPYEQEGGNLLVDVVVNRRFPVRLLVDSGTAYTTIDGTTLRRMGVAPGAGAPTVTINTPAGQQTDVIITLDTIALGGLEVVGPAVMRCNECRTLNYHGILGYNVLSNFQMSIDNAQSLLLFEDRRNAADRREDIRPFVTLAAKAIQSNSSSFQPFVITATSRAPRLIGALFARLTLMDSNRQPVGGQDIKLPPLPPGEKISTRVDVPRNPPFTYYAVELGSARW